MWDRKTGSILTFFYLLSFYSPAHAQQQEGIVAQEYTPAIQSGIEKLGIHGFFDWTFANYYITPRGLLVTDTGLTLRLLDGFSIIFYQNSEGWLNNASLIAGCLNDIWTDQDHPTAGVWREFDWNFGFNFILAKKWKFGVQFLQFLSPPGNFRPESNIEFYLGFDNSKPDCPFSFNPYVKLFWAVAGDSVVVVGRRGKTYDVEVGMVPTLAYKKDVVFPITLTMPTWFTVGPTHFWSGGKNALKHENKHFGVFSTGLQALVPLEFIPVKFGAWYFTTGFQYFYLINRNLLRAQVYTLGTTLHHAHRNVCLGYAAFGINW